MLRFCARFLYFNNYGKVSYVYRDKNKIYNRLKGYDCMLCMVG